MTTDMDALDALTEQIIGAGIDVHREHGPGLLESIYCECMIVELSLRGLKMEYQRRVRLEYKGHQLSSSFRIDLIVENSVVVELKAVEQLAAVHVAQLITYLKLTGCPLGLLMNFNAPTIRAGLRRVVHPALYQQQRQRRIGTRKPRDTSR